MRALQTQRPDEPGEGVDQVVQAVVRGRQIGGFTAAGSVPGDDGELGGEGVQLPPPVPAIAERSMQQQQGRAVPGTAERDGQPVYVDTVHLSALHQSTVEQRR
jgi:hypothetical protein